MTRLGAPGPMTVTSLTNVSGLSRKIVAGNGTLKLIVSPDTALAIASRREPAPLSCVFTTVMVPPNTDDTLSTSAMPAHRPVANLPNGNELIASPPVRWLGGGAHERRKPCGGTSLVQRESPDSDESGLTGQPP